MSVLSRLLLSCFYTALAGCAILAPGESVELRMGEALIRTTGPPGYQSASWALPLAAQSFTPPENVFALFLPAGQNSAGADGTLRGMKQVIFSARPEFMNDAVEDDFFQALCRDFIRVQGVFQPEFLEEFRQRADALYQGLETFSHNLGVFHHTERSLSMARITRHTDGALPGAGDPGAPASQGQEKPAASSREWAEEYFAAAGHSILVHNVILSNGRCFNIHFSAPLARAEDIRALMDETRRYMEGLPTK